MSVALAIAGGGPALAQACSMNTRIDDLAGATILAAAAGKVELLEGKLEHFFAPGVYLRVYTMPAGSFCIGKEHRTKHINWLRTGLARVIMDEQLYHLSAGDIFISDAGIRKVLFMEEETSWCTIHPVLPAEEAEPDVQKRIAILEDRLSVNSPVHERYIEEAEKLRKWLLEEVRT